MDPLIGHKYSVLEIERMRKATDGLMFPSVWLSANTSFREGSGGMRGEQEAKVEVQLRTYMLAGIRPEELEDLWKEREKAHQLARPKDVERA